MRVYKTKKCALSNITQQNVYWDQSNHDDIKIVIFFHRIIEMAVW